ncbi:MAG: methionine gamma-lyase family protein, partial [Butyricicoccus sp.]|nr:methionine gamma-lyase family protein [Butyricicoccus sp.]
MENYLGISEQTYALGREAERKIAPYFARLEEICDRNTEKVLGAFRRHRVSDTMFAGTTGYGYDDQGRDTLDKIYADLFGAEAGLVRIGFVNGTHALSCAMFSAVQAGDVVLSVTSAPYDTLLSTITGDCAGSMKRYGIGYRQVDLKDGLPDLPAIRQAAADPQIKLVFIQRSRGYAVRQTLSCAQIREICAAVREVNPHAAILVDNCYGEFTETIEPTQVGADLCAGSLIKNPGGGLAPTGGYIVGRADLVENAAYRLTAPGIGGECGCTMGQNRLLYQGLFLAPHVTMQAIKTAIFCAQVMQDLGFTVDPAPETPRYDIIQTIAFGAPAPLRRFC